jgi:zinc metalloprotease ZmpA
MSAGGALATVLALALATGGAALAGSGTPWSDSVEKPTTDSAIAKARANVTANGGKLGFTKGQSLVTVDSIVDRDGSSHVRFNRTYNGLPVIGGDFVVHQDASGKFKSASGKFAPSGAIRSGISTKPGVAAAKAADTAAKSVAFEAAKSKPTLVVDATGTKPLLAWSVDVRGAKKGVPAGERVLVDAASGKVTRSVPTVLNEAGKGKSLYLGEVAVDTTKEGEQFTLIDPVRGNGATYDAKGSDNPEDNKFLDDDNNWGDGTTNDPASAAVDAHYGVAETWDYFKEVHGRNGIADDGKGAKSYVHVSKDWFNAAWDDACFCMLYGDGDGTTAGPLVELDIAGHEMSHGVTSRTANLEYSGESGGLNEATSDIFGTMVEAYANNAEDKPDYVLGEEIFLDFDPAKNYIRRMDKPSVDGSSVDCWSADVGQLDVHYSSGVANHFFYLLSEGSGAKDINGVPHDSPTCDNSTLEGIGSEKAAAIWYKALTEYMTSTTDYKGAREATLSATADLYGAGSPEAEAVAKTWTAVSVS